MPWSLDARIPVGIGLPGRGPFAVLVPPGAQPTPGAIATETVLDASEHAAACACCAGRSPAAIALDRLFQARVRGIVPWFEIVFADPSLAATVRTALTEDALTVARYRLAT